MGLNTYPSNPFPPSTDRMDAGTLESEVSKLNNDVSELKSGLTNYELQNNINLEVPNRKNLAGNPYGVMLNSSSVFVSANVRSYIIPTNLGTITISVDDITKISDDVIRIGYCDDIPAESGTGVRVSSMTTNTYTITPNTGYKYIVVSNLLDNDYGWQDIQIELGETATAYTPYIPSVESRIEAVESGVAGIVCTEIVYDDSASLFTLPAGVSKPKDGAQIIVCGRNRSTGAIYALWFDNSASGFKIGKILDGSAPADGTSISVQYIA